MRGIAVLLIVTLILAGCTQPGDRPDRVPVVDPNAPDEEPDPEPEPEPEPEDDGNETETPENRPPTATLSASVDSDDDLLVFFELSGGDPDDDALSWTLDLGVNGTAARNGTELPSELNHTYAEAGEYTVVLTVSDGELEGNATVTLSLGQSGGGGGVVQAASTSWPIGPYGCGAPYATHEPGLPAAGVLYGEVAVNGSALGVHFRAVFNGTDGGGIVQFFDGNGTALADHAASNSTALGVVPDAAVTAVFSNCGPEGGSAEFTVDPAIEVPDEEPEGT